MNNTKGTKHIIRLALVTMLALILSVPYAYNIIASATISQYPSTLVKATLVQGDNEIVGLDEAWEWSLDKEYWTTGKEGQRFGGGTTVYVAPADKWADARDWALAGEGEQGRDSYNEKERAIYKNALYEAKYWSNLAPDELSTTGELEWNKLDIPRPTAEYTFVFEQKSDEEMIAFLEKERTKLLAKRKVFAYMPSWGAFDAHDQFDPNTIDYSGVTHVTYSFLKPVNMETNNPTIEWDDEWAAFGNTTSTWRPGMTMGYGDDSNNVAFVPKIYDALQKHKDKYFVFSVGGWNYSIHDEFERATDSPAKIEAFAQNIVNLMLTYGFDGIDIDWEYPTNETYAQQFLDLHKVLRQKLTAQGIKDAKYYQLSCATTPNAQRVQYISPKELVKYVDTVNFMSYDYNGGSFGAETPTAHNAPLYESVAGSREEGFWIDNVLHEYLAQGVPRNQLMFGLPFYSRSWLDVDNQENIPDMIGLDVTGYAPPTEEEVEYGEITDDAGRWGNGCNPYYGIEMLIADSTLEYKKYWDYGSMTPYIYSAKTKKFHSYDDTNSIQTKVNYLMAHNLAGAIIWDITGDTRSNQGTSPKNVIGNIIKPIVDTNVAIEDKEDTAIINMMLPNAKKNINYNTIGGSIVRTVGQNVTTTLGADKPSWLSISQDGVLSGTPTETSTSTKFTVIASSSSNGTTFERTFTISVVDSTQPPTKPDPPVISTTTLPDAIVGKDYGTISGTQISASGSSVTFAKGEASPSWLTVSSAGKLGGTPATPASNVTIEIEATDSAGQTVKKSFVIDVIADTPDAPAITTTSLPNARVGKEYGTLAGTKIVASGSNTIFKLGNAPSWISISSDGQLSGTPTTAATSVGITVIAKDGDSSESSKTFTISVIEDIPDAPLISTSSLPDAKVDQSYATLAGTKIVASGSNTIFKLGNAPSWISISSDGQLSGTPTVAATSVGITVIAKDGKSEESTRTFVISVLEDIPDAPLISTSSLPDAKVDQSYATLAGTKIVASGSNTTFRLGSAPSWIAISSDGQLSGTPTVVATGVSITVIAKDGKSAESTRTFVISVISDILDAPTITTTQLPNAKVGEEYSTLSGSKIFASGTNNIFSIESAPSWITIFSDGQLRGTPLVAENNVLITVGVVDGQSAKTVKTFVIDVVDNKPKPPIITTVNLPNSKVGVEYSTLSGSKVIASGSDIMFLLDNNKPNWLSISSDGQLSGKPTQSQDNVVITIIVKDNYDQTASKTYIINIQDASPEIDLDNIPNGEVNQFYNVSMFTASQSTNIDIIAGTLPKGLKLYHGRDNKFTIQGYPLEAGTYEFTMSAYNSSRASSVEKTYKVNIGESHIVLEPYGKDNIAYILMIIAAIDIATICASISVIRTRNRYRQAQSSYNNSNYRQQPPRRR